MPEEPKVCPECGAPTEARPDGVAPLCPKCTEAADSELPARKGASLWWLLGLVICAALVLISLFYGCIFTPFGH
jgi:uncharacterized paraquat-inducible protein A